MAIAESDSGSEKVMETSVISPRKITPTSKTRRTKGKGSGWIQCKPIKRSGKESAILIMRMIITIFKKMSSIKPNSFVNRLNFAVKFLI